MSKTSQLAKRSSALRASPNIAVPDPGRDEEKINGQISVSTEHCREYRALLKLAAVICKIGRAHSSECRRGRDPVRFESVSGPFVVA